MEKALGLLAVAWVIVLSGAAIAATAAPTQEAIDLHPWIEAIRPFTDILVPPAVLAILGWMAQRFQKTTGVNMQNAAVDRIKSSFATQAGIAVAAAEDNLTKRVITVDSPIVAAAVNTISKNLPEAIKLSGLTTQGLARAAAGEFGKLQAQQTAPVVVSIPAVPPAK